MPIKPSLEFPPNEAGEKEGLGDAGIETFRNRPYASCAREAGQNSGDAADGHPVRLTFDVLEITVGDFPAHGELSAAVDACLSAATQEKDQDFFGQARRLLDADHLKVLRISDFNTKGLVGPPDDEGTPFNALLKGSGVSDHKSDTSGGSFGIGKNASFAVSDLRTVFYSTVYRAEPNVTAFAAQGKVRLVSHVDSAARKRRATGYWGWPEGLRAVTDRADVPVWLDRAEVGTSIFSVGFQILENWAERIGYALLTNFFGAITTGEMVFEVDDGRLKINRNTIGQLFQDEAIKRAAVLSGQATDLEFSEQLYRCFVSPDVEVSEFDIAGLGRMRLRLLKEEGLPKRVGIIRNGMLITTDLKHFGSKLERFKGSRDFVAVLEPADDPASKLLKTLENPEHNSFSAERLSNPVKREAAELAMRRLDRELRELIRSATAIVIDEEVTIDELSDFFAEDDAGDRPPSPDAENNPEAYVYRPAQRQPLRSRDQAAEGGDDGGGGEGRTSRSGGRTAGPKRGPGTGGKGRQGQADALELKEFRNRLPDAAGSHSKRRKVWFTPTIDGEAAVRLNATGINSAERLRVVTTTLGRVEDGAVVLDFAAGKRVELEVEFDSAYGGPIEPVAHAVTVAGAAQ